MPSVELMEAAGGEHLEVGMTCISRICKDRCEDFMYRPIVLCVLSGLCVQAYSFCVYRPIVSVCIVRTLCTGL